MKVRTARAALLAALIMAAGAACGSPVRTRPVDLPPEPGGSGVIGTLPPGAVLPVDVLLEDRLLTTEGREISFADRIPCEPCRVTSAWRVPDGWLVTVDQTGEPATPAFALWHLPESGRPAVVVKGEGFPLVSRGTSALPGIRVAWVDDGYLYLGSYADGSVSDVVDTLVPEVEVEPVGDLGGTRPLWPQAIVGDAVVLAGTNTGGGLDLWDVWQPARGRFVPATYPVIDRLGTTLDGERILGDYRRYPGTQSKETCLGELSPVGFTPVHSACPSPIEHAFRIDPAPDGRWWMVSDPDGLALYDAERVWSGAEPARTWPRASSGGGFWRDAGSFVGLSPSGVVTLHTDGRPDETVSLPLPPSAAVVVDLRGES